MVPSLKELIERYAAALAMTIANTRATQDEIKQILVQAFREFVAEFLSIAVKQIDIELRRAFQ